MLWTGQPPILLPGKASQRKWQRHWRNVLDWETLALQRTEDCFTKIEADPMLDYNLPCKPGMLAGTVLKHCYQVVDDILSSQSPCILKVGYTHCAHYRFHNQIFGYKHESDNWEKMIVIFASSETVAPAFIEGAIIQRHKGFLIKHIHTFVTCKIVWSSLDMQRVYLLACLGQPGFRNTRDGGESIHTDKPGPHLVYLVYRSFRKPPT